MAIYAPAAWLIAGALAASPAVASTHAEGWVRTVAERPIAALLEELTPRLMALPGVVGVGEGRCDGEPCVRVMVEEKSADLVAQIDRVLDGATAEIVETGAIRARPER